MNTEQAVNAPAEILPFDRIRSLAPYRIGHNYLGYAAIRRDRDGLGGEVAFIAADRQAVVNWIYEHTSQRPPWFRGILRGPITSDFA